MASLLIDVGNTRLKWGLADGAGTIVDRGVLSTAEVATLAAVLHDRRVAADRALFVSVAGDEVNQRVVQALAGLNGGRVARFVSTPRAGALRNDYAEASQLGADRLAAALGAWRRVGGDCLVVSCGTATTIDVVQALAPSSGTTPAQAQPADAPRARFAGGLILPGLSLMKSALFRNTARLPDAAGRLVAIPTNTDDAIESGCLLAQCGAVEAMARNFATPVPVVLAGGAADALRPLLKSRGMSLVDAPELVLEGLSVAILHRFS